MCLTCTLYLSFILFLTTVSLTRADIRPIRALLHLSHPLLDRPFIKEAFYFCLPLSHSNTHTHTQYLPQCPLSPWPYLLHTTLSGSNVSHSSFQHRHCSPQQLSHSFIHINTSQCQITKGRSEGRIIQQDIQILKKAVQNTVKGNQGRPQRTTHTHKNGMERSI